MIVKINKFFVGDIPRDSEMDEALKECNDLVKKKMSKILGLSSTPWDVRFEKCRLKENNVGSFLCDLMRE